MKTRNMKTYGSSIPALTLMAGIVGAAAVACTQEKEVVKYFNVNAATPQILAQPQNKSILKGSTDTLKVDAFVSTDTRLSYKWYKGTKDGSNPIVWDGGAEGSNELALETSAEGTTYYKVVVTNHDDAAASRGGLTTMSTTSNQAEVKVGTKSAPTPEFATKLKDAEYSTTRATPVLLEVAMKPAADVIQWTYKWEESDAEDGTYSELQGGTRTLDTAGLADKGTSNFYVYTLPTAVGTKYVRVTAIALIAGEGTAGVAQARDTSTTTAKIRMYTAYVKIKELKDVSCTVGDTKSFSVTTDPATAPSGTTFTYQWEKKNSSGTWEPITGAGFTDVRTNPHTLSLTTDVAKDETYRVTVRATNDNDTNEPPYDAVQEVKLKVAKKVAKPNFDALPSSATDGSSITLQNVTGNGTLSYQWYERRNGAETQVGGNSDTLTSVRSGSCYYVKVKDEITATTDTLEKGEDTKTSSNVCVN